jgi:hypothetical protein
VADPVAERLTETVAIAELRPHPENYRVHTDQQLEHIAESLREHGQYRNVVVARDLTILAGHGVVESADQKLGWTEITVVRLDLDPDDPRALKLLVSDNELGRLADVDDRLLSEHLKAILEHDGRLLGTGFDEAMLANLVFVTRPETEIPSLDAAAEWAGAGMPGFEEFILSPRLVISFDSDEDRAKFMELVEIEVITRKERGSWSARWPPRPKEDLSSLFIAPG